MKLDIKKFAGDTWELTTSFSNYKYNANGELIQVTLTITSTYNVSSIYDIDNEDNETYNYSSWENHHSSDSYPHTDMPYIRRTFYNLNNLKGVKLVTYESPNAQTQIITYNFKMGTGEEQKTTYLTKTSATVLNSLNTYDWNNAPSVAAVRNYLDSGSFVHQNDVESIVSQAISNALLAAHPVGSIEINITGTNPSEYLGGTWEQIKDVFLLAAGNTYVGGTSGGAATVQLTVNQLPKVSGSWSIHAQEGGTEWYGKSGYATGTVHNGYRTLINQGTSGRATSLQNPGFAFGNNEAHNNMPPYIVVYVWKRIS